MLEEFHTEDISAAGLGDTLNALGKDGWLLVNCWPSDGGKVTCVLRREHVYYCRKTKRYEPAHHPDRLTLEAALDRCLAEPKKSFQGHEAKHHLIPLAKLGEEFWVGEEDMVQLLKKKGLKEYPAGSGHFSAIVGDHSLWIYRKTAKEPWGLYAKPVDKTKASKPSEKSAPGPAVPATAGTEGAESAAGFSVADAIALCIAQEPKNKGWDHGIALTQAAKAQGASVEDALKAFQEIGLPTAEHADKKKCYVTWRFRQVALKEGKGRPGFWFLNVKS